MPCRHSNAARFTSPCRTIPTSAARASAKSRTAGWWSDRASPRVAEPMPGRAAAERVRKAITLVDAVADGPGDEDITPTEIAGRIRDCLELAESQHRCNVRTLLSEARDAVYDLMPA